MTLAPILLTEEEVQALAELTRHARQSNGPQSGQAELFDGLYKKVSYAANLAHRAITEEGSSGVTIYNPANETATIQIELATVQGPPNVVVKTLLTEAYETLLAIVTLGG